MKYMYASAFIQISLAYLGVYFSFSCNKIQSGYIWNWPECRTVGVRYSFNTVSNLVENEPST